MAKRILLADDEVNLRKLTKSRLEANNYEVLDVEDGKGAIDRVKEFRPDLILLDIVMPGMNGYEICKILRADEETRQIPIIIFTASQEKELETMCLEAGATDVIMKPFVATDLLTKIKEILG